MKRYGLPYKGSKNSIAQEIVELLPPADCYVDVFAGGCAIMHAALESGKYSRYIANDICDAPKLFKRAIDGELRNERRWISREDFAKLKDNDPYIRFCWAFGNNGEHYLYSKEIEPWKRAVHYARVYGDYSELAKFGIRSDGSRADILANKAEYKEKYIVWYQKNVMMSTKDADELRKDLEGNIERNTKELQKYLDDAKARAGVGNAEIDRRCGTNGMAGHWFGRSQWEFPTREMYNKLREFMPLEKDYDEVYGLQDLLQSLQRLQRLQRLQSLQSLERLQSLQSLEVYQGDYQSINIPPGSVIYCDIPYRGTDGYEGGFNHESFYKWAMKQGNIYISEYWMPEPFICIWEREKSQLLSGSGAGKKVVEKIYTVPHNDKRPLTMFDFICR